MLILALVSFFVFCLLLGVLLYAWDPKFRELGLRDTLAISFLYACLMTVLVLLFVAVFI